MTKKIFSIILSLILVATCLSAQASAAVVDTGNSEIAPAYSYTISASSTLSINSSKTATCKSVVAGMSGIATKIVFTQRLQKKVNGTWTNVKTWTGTYERVSASFTNTKTSLASGTYRVRTIAKVYSGSAYETVTTNSTTVTC